MMRGPAKKLPTDEPDPPKRGLVTELLRKASAGDPNASKALFEQVYRELKKMAAGKMKEERADHTFQPTDLVHEAFIQLIDKDQITPQNRGHFFGICSESMRRILVDYARARNAQKRGGDANLFRLQDMDDIPGIADPDRILALNLELETLEKIDVSRARLVELRLFAGLTLEEAAQALDVPYSTVQRKWKSTRAWLQDRL